MDKYTIVVVTDDHVTFSKIYLDAVSAVTDYNKFVDHGICQKWRKVTLREPNGRDHIKMFEHPLAAKLAVK
jgi:hypothetical protein